MKIMNVRFKNLNSLVGEWQINLMDSAFTSEGIFAITGPTGAGKTTILDAICLALYGRTPRLSKVTKNENEIMSRQTGECFAEVTFETQTGRYRCHWSQHRARKKPNGDLQAPKHEISNADTGDIFESKLRGVAEQIESVTGMDFERFSRSMLLAQGGFATFLQATPDDRAPILEQITGTEIYSKISIRVHERQRDEKNKLTQLQAETAGITILEPEQEKEIGLRLEAKQKEEKKLTSSAKETQKAIDWLNLINELEKEIGELVVEEDQLKVDSEAFKSDHEKLNKALNALSLDGDYATLTTIRKQQTDEKATLKDKEENLPELESSVQKQVKALNLAEQQTLNTKNELQNAIPQLQNIRSIDQQISHHKQDELDKEKYFREIAINIRLNIKDKIKNKKQLLKHLEDLNISNTYLQQNAHDEWLISGLEGIKVQLQNLISQQKEIFKKDIEKNNAIEKLKLTTISCDNCQKQYDILKQQCDKISNKIQQKKDILSQMLNGRLLREYRTEKETLLRERAFLTKIAELEDYRAKLEDGKPCPLCGATEHPFAKGNVPVPDETDRKIASLTSLIAKAENQETVITNLEKDLVTAKNNLSEAEKKKLIATNNKNVANNNLTELNSRLITLHTEFANGRQEVATKLQPLGIAEVPATGISSLLKTLTGRMETWQMHAKKKTSIENQISEIKNNVIALGAVIKTQRTDLHKAGEHIKNLKNELAKVKNERYALFGDKNPDAEELRLNKAVSDAEESEKEIRNKHNECQQLLNTAKSHIASLKDNIAQREPNLKNLETEFSSKLLEIGFLNEEIFLTSRLSSSDLEELKTKAKDLENRKMELNTKKMERKHRLDTEKYKNITDKPLEELVLQFNEQEDELKKLRQFIADLNYKIKENLTAKERIQEKQTAIEAQSKECRRWDNLHELIGSADGKKYRNFAQGLTFEIMVGYANNQLLKMTDRYLLVRDNAHPLELNVIDNYQAGETRSTKNLSGGESFIVSLSLALGLSQMASKNVRVDSLFLDEGFGTLDEEALDTALETLAGLHHSGKLIGVISHVSALKERIHAQIEVTPQTGGKSKICGPGCQCIAAS